MVDVGRARDENSGMTMQGAKRRLGTTRGWDGGDFFWGGLGVGSDRGRGGLFFFGLCCSAFAGVDHSGRGFNPRPAQVFFGLCCSAFAGVDRSGRGFNPRPAQVGGNPRPAQTGSSRGATPDRLKGDRLKGDRHSFFWGEGV